MLISETQVIGIERTLVIIKSHTIQRKIVGKIIQIFEDAGLNIIAMKMLKPTQTQAELHYLKSDKWKINVGTRSINYINVYNNPQEILGTTDALQAGENIYKWSVEQLCSGPVIVLVLEGPNAIEKVKYLSGSSIETSEDLSTIRGEFCSDSIIVSSLDRRAVYNVIHRSSDREEAQREISLWFNEDELNT